MKSIIRSWPQITTVMQQTWENVTFLDLQASAEIKAEENKVKTEVYKTETDDTTTSCRSTVRV